jgi:LuxR family maltose regulon positive regulatory protein
MFELRTQDLRFTRQEATQLLNDVMRLGLSAEDIEILEAHTEGWVVGLKMAALSIQGRDDATGFIREFSGSHRYVLDYLVEEVLRRQPAHIQTFLLETSILGKLNGPLCEALMNEEWKQAGESGQAVLEYLERSNLFVIPLDERKQWYRYHHLFADLLHSRLQQFSMENVASLHTKASQWFEINGLYEEALFHSIRAKDFTRAVSLIEQSALPLMARNDFSTCLLWLEAIPNEVSENHPLLGIYKAWICARLGRIDEVELLLQRATGLIQSRPEDAGTKEMAGYIALVRANVANLQGKTAFAVEQTEKARGLLSIKSTLALDNVSFQRGFAHFVDGDFASAREVWLEVARAALAVQDFDTYANTMAELADLNKLQGELRQAYQLYQDARKQLQQYSCPIFLRGVLEIGMADLMTEWNKLEDAHRLISEGIDHAQKGERPNTVCFGYYVQSRLLLALNQLDHAQAAIAQAEKIRSEHALYPRAVVETESAKVRLWIAQSNLEAASSWLKHHHPVKLDTFDFRHELEYITCARILIAENHMDTALELLIPLAWAAEAGKRTGRLIEIFCLYALALQASGRQEEANMILAKSLCQAEPEGYMRAFLDEGKPMIQLLKQLQASKSTTQLRRYMKWLLEAGRAETNESI